MPRKETARHRSAFQVWYENNRDFVTTHQKLPQKIKPESHYTLYDWAGYYDWQNRADALDAEVERRLNAEAVTRKVEMLKRHAQFGKLMQTKGGEYLRDHGVDNSASAITAVKTGIDVERKAEGLPDWIAAILGKDDHDLLSEYRDVIAQVGGHGSGDETAGDDAAAEDARQE